MENNFKFLIYAFLSLLFSLESTAQSQTKSGAIATQKGVFIYTGGNLDKNGYYKIDRKKIKERKYKEVGKTTIVKSISKAKDRAKEASVAFEQLKELTQKDIECIYNYIQVNKTDESLYRAESLPIIAMVSGTGFLDRTAKKGEAYDYRVTFYINGVEQGQQTLKNVKNSIKTNLPKPTFYKSEVVNDAVFLEWEVSDVEEMAMFNVYRAYFGTNEFKKITTKTGYSKQNDKTRLIVIDTTSEKRSLYKYYIQPVDLYGNVSESFEVITAGKLTTETIAPILFFNVENIEGYRVKLSWKLNKDVIRSNIKVFRSNNFDSGFVEVSDLPASTTEFIDYLPEASENYYYYLILNGGRGQVFTSSKIAAIVKENTNLLPEPREVSGKIENDGIQISWRYDEPNTRGFYIYRASEDTNNFVQISNLIKFNGSESYSYKDKSKNLRGGEMYRYTLRAENDAYTLGKFSDTVYVNSYIKPRINVPQNLNGTLGKNRIELYWKDMREESKTLLGYKVYRFEGEGKSAQLLQNDTLNAAKNFYYDAHIELGKTYTYKVASIDLFGQESELSFEAKVEVSREKDNTVVQPNKPKLYKNSEGVVISWHLVNPNNIKEVKIYRSVENEKTKTLKKVMVAEGSFVDTSVKKGVVYFYSISFINSNKKEGKSSEEVSINYY